MAQRRVLYRRMTGRRPDESHRTATPLELLFDLCFVVAVASASAHLHHSLREGEVGHAIFGYLTVFFAIWWAWMNFTWFASAYDTDDVPYRLTTLVQIAGALVLAAGIPRAFDEADFTIPTIGYVVMRLALVAQWLRVAYSDRAHRRTAVRFAVGVGLVQVGWVARLALPDPWLTPAFFVLAVGDLAVPAAAERAGGTTWHPRHIAERYGLFTIIMLGESVLAATFAIQAAVTDRRAGPGLVLLAGAGLVVVYAMWWLYFDRPGDRLDNVLSRPFVWGEGHYLVFAAAAAVGAGLSVAADHETGRAHLSTTMTGYATAAPVAVYLVTVWLLQVRPRRRDPVAAGYPVAAALVLLTPLVPAPVVVTALLLSALVAVSVLVPAPSPPARPRQEAE